MNDAQPIETVPVNTPVLVFVPASDDTGEPWWRAICFETTYGRQWHSTALHGGRDFPIGYEPTHWTSLPPRPRDLEEVLTARFKIMNSICSDCKKPDIKGGLPVGDHSDCSPF